MEYLIGRIAVDVECCGYSKVKRLLQNRETAGDLRQISQATDGTERPARYNENEYNSCASFHRFETKISE